VARAVAVRGLPWAEPALVALLVAAALAEVVVRAGPDSRNVNSTLAVGLLAVAGIVPLTLPNRGASAGLSFAAGTLSLAAFDLLSVAALAALLLALYRLACAQRRRPLLELAALALAAPFLLLAFLGPSPSSSASAALTLVSATLVPLAWLSGLSTRAGREAEESRAAHELIAGTLVEHSARSERVRISRELHDVVAHHISMVAVQAETARLAVPGLSPAGAERLLAIGDTARTALSEMRRLLGVLRADGSPEPAERHPQPGLDQVGELVDDSRQASACATRLILSGRPVVLAANVQLAAYRIVQEALTNTRRHAPGAAVDVELFYGDGQFRLRVRDNGPGPSAAASRADQHGITGMRERAAAAGGSVRVGAAAGGGHLVEALFPIARESDVEHRTGPRIGQRV
jgi:signal transduction histidine kinase